MTEYLLITVFLTFGLIIFQPALYQTLKKVFQKAGYAILRAYH